MVSVTDETQRPTRRKFNTGFDRFSGVYLGALFIVVFGIWVPSEFLTTSTLHSVAAQQAVTGMIGSGRADPARAGPVRPLGRSHGERLAESSASSC